MNEPVSPTQLVEINRICDPFEAEWCAGGRPKVEDHLTANAEPVRSALLKELLAVELECRQSVGERPERAEYRARFPQHLIIVEAAFQSREKAANANAPGPGVRAVQPRAARRHQADSNLLFGVLALQMDFVTRDTLVDAMNAWMVRKHRTLAEIMEEQGALSAGDRAMLEPLVRRHIEQHGGDPAQSLAALSSVQEMRQDLDPIGDADPDVQQSLQRLGAGLRPRPAGSRRQFDGALRQPGRLAGRTVPDPALSQPWRARGSVRRQGYGARSRRRV